LVLAVLLILAMFAVAAPIWASGDDRDGDATATADSSSVSGADAVANAMSGDLIGGDSTLSTSNKTFAFSHSLGDVDINEGKNCLGSEAWGSFIVSRQTNELNPWCAALFYELNGRHEFAAKMRCDIKEIRKKYASAEACWSDQDLTPAQPLGEGSSGIADAIVSHIDETVVQHDEDLEQVQMQLAEVTERLDEYEHRPAPRPQGIQQAAPDPGPRYSDEEFEQIWGLLKGGDEDE
jgi:uncharacterized coiled-coil protein SlyX